MTRLEYLKEAYEKVGLRLSDSMCDLCRSIKCQYCPGLSACSNGRMDNGIKNLEYKMNQEMEGLQWELSND